MTKKKMVKKGGENPEGQPADLLSLTRLAAELRVDRGTLSRKVASLDHVAGPRGARLYSRAAVEELLAADEDPEMEEARRRKVAAEAELLELKLGRERGELLPAKEVWGHLFHIFRAIRQRVQVRQPREISHQLYRAESPAHVQEILEREAGRMFKELLEDHGRFITNTEGADHGKA